MESVSEQYLQSSVKLIVEVGGETVLGTGFIYHTSTSSEFDYVFSTKHTLMCHPDDVKIYINQISFIEVQEYNVKKERFEKLEKIVGREIEEKIIEFEVDLIILKVRKNNNNIRKFILVSDEGTQNCTAYAMTKANVDTLVPLDLTRLVKKQKRYSIVNWKKSDNLAGSSGSAILAKDQPILQGFIMRIPTKEFSGKYIDAVNISFKEINEKLYFLGIEQLNIENQSKIARNLDNKEIVNIEEANINGVKLNLLQATIRLSIDCRDDWFHDPLSYVDLRNTDYLFNFFQKNFLGSPYTTNCAESFFLPKSSLTLRKALLLSYPDRLFYTALVDSIGSKIDSSLLPIVYSSRYNNSRKGGLLISGVEQWKKMMYQVQTYSKQYNYIIEIDILNFFDNIDTNLLCEKLLMICETKNDRSAVNELRSILSSFSNKANNGIPQNNDASSLLATFYLNEIDTYMQHYVPKYLRFMDDIKIFCQDEFDARKYLSLIEIKLRELKLSLNGQKTKIINLNPVDEKIKAEITEIYQKFFNLERSKLATLASSDSYINRNEAFHLSTKLILNNINEDSIGKQTNERTLLLALTILKNSKVRGVSLNKNKPEIIEILCKLPRLLKERPWITPQIAYILAIIDFQFIPESTWNEIIEIVISEKFNTYSWQCYHLWLLLAKRKIKDQRLSTFASKVLDSNDDLNRPVVGALMLYMGSIDENYRRIVLSKYKNNFAKGEFQRRAALITLRSFNTEDVCLKDSNDSITHKSLNNNKEKELIFFYGESEKDYSEIIQIYSL